MNKKVSKKIKASKRYKKVMKSTSSKRCEKYDNDYSSMNSIEILPTKEW